MIPRSLVGRRMDVLRLHAYLVTGLREDGCLHLHVAAWHKDIGDGRREAKHRRVDMGQWGREV